MEVSHQLQRKPLRCLGLAREADTKATGPKSTLPVPGNYVCLFSECDPPGHPWKGVANWALLLFQGLNGQGEAVLHSWHRLLGLVPLTFPMNAGPGQYADGLGSLKGRNFMFP